jgi:hypothetical protein
MTSTPKALLRQITDRDGHVSFWTGDDVPELVPQHRQGGMGGSKRKHRPSNVVWLESLLNGHIESDPELQAEAVRRGIKVSQHADPEKVPIMSADGSWWLLTDDGEKTPYAGDWEGERG